MTPGKPAVTYTEIFSIPIGRKPNLKADIGIAGWLNDARYTTEWLNAFDRLAGGRRKCACRNIHSGIDHCGGKLAFRQTGAIGCQDGSGTDETSYGKGKEREQSHADEIVSKYVFAG